MTRIQLDKWLKLLGKAWVEKKPEIMAEICDKNVKYFETPFGKPYTSPAEVVKLWQNDVPGQQKNIKFDYDILVVTQKVGIAHWRAGFTRVKDSSRVVLDGIFQVKLNRGGKCTEFRQWWVVK